jgi:hypothetical protein
MWNPLFQYFMLFSTIPFWQAIGSHWNRKGFMLFWKQLNINTCINLMLLLFGILQLAFVLRLLTILFLSLNSSWNINLLLVLAEILVFTTSWLSLPITPTTQSFHNFATLISESSYCFSIQRPKSLSKHIKHYLAKFQQEMRNSFLIHFLPQLAIYRSKNCQHDKL